MRTGQPRLPVALIDLEVVKPPTATRSGGVTALRKKGGDPAARSRTATLLRLHPNHQPDARHLPPRGVGPAPSRLAGFRGVTGGVYKARERIHRTMLTRGY